MRVSPYFDEKQLRSTVSRGGHREAIGGLWEEMGQLQIEFLLAQGLSPAHRLLDVGCGALRFGVKAVDYLDAGHYYGIDISESLIAAGYERELDDAQRVRLPRRNLHATANFDLSFLDAGIDMALAQSVFTHLPFNHIRRCLDAVAGRLVPGGRLYATAWIVGDAWPVAQPHDWAGTIDGQPIRTFDIADPYHYRLADFEHAVEGLPLDLEWMGNWGHPRGLPMMVFHRR